MGDFYYLDYEYKNLEKHFDINLKRVNIFILFIYIIYNINI